MDRSDDPLWAHFEPLWNDLKANGADPIVAGGYGLFLKQGWLAEEGGSRIVIPLENWRDARPRATKDMDFLIGLDLIAEEERNKQLGSILQDHGFDVSEESGGKRWQFIKQIDEHHSVIAELHAPTPPKEERRLESRGIRVKHVPSLGQSGIHGRHNPEAVGCKIAPFRFAIGGTEVVVPNTVTWSLMKLTAARDQWTRAQDSNVSAGNRDLARSQSVKHANDVCRAVAMTTEDEMAASAEIVAAIRETQPFERAGVIFRDFFAREEQWAREMLREHWQAGDLGTILDVISSWYGPE